MKVLAALGLLVALAPFVADAAEPRTDVVLAEVVDRSESTAGLYTAAFGTAVAIKQGDALTVLPVDPALPVAASKAMNVVETTKCESGRREGTSPFWHIETEPIRRDDYRAKGGYSFTALVFYPARPKAKSLPISVLKSENLPRDVELASASIAVSMDGDDTVDLFITASCEKCDYAFRKAYIRESGGWKLFKEYPIC